MATMQDTAELELVKVRERRWWTGTIDELKGIAKEPRGMISLVILLLLILFAFVLPIFDSTDPNFILEPHRDAKPVQTRAGALCNPEEAKVA